MTSKLVFTKAQIILNYSKLFLSIGIFSAAAGGKEKINATKSEFWSHDDDEDKAHSDEDISASEGWS